ncbi:MAG: ParB N-terminal domain-containing protein [Roseibium sp.]
MQIQTIKITDIVVPDGRLRSVDPDWADALAGMFQEVGHKVPIDVISAGEGYELIAGGHRLAAAKLLKWKTIDARLLDLAEEKLAEELRLHEILENLARKDFNALERCEGLHELKRIYGALHPATKNGGRRGNQYIGGQKRQIAIFAFCQNASETTGLSRRSIELAVQIFEGLSPDTRARLKGTVFADKQSDLKALSELDATEQQKILDLLLTSEPEVTIVSDALVLIDGKKPLSAADKVFRATQGGLNKLTRVSRSILFAHYKDEILALAKKEGWFNA